MYTCDLSVDEFDTYYSAPIKVCGQNLENVENIHEFYRAKMLECTTVTQMRDVCEEFGFLAEDALEVLENVKTWQLPTIKKFWYDDAVLTQEEEELFAPLIMPVTMLFSRMIADQELQPEYYAAYNYVRTVMYCELH